MPTNVPSVDVPNYFAQRRQSSNPSPLKLLQQAAEQMTTRTNGLVVGEVFVAPFAGTTRYTFYLEIPTLNDYSDSLFYVWTDQANFGYPVHVIADGNQEDNRVYKTATAFASRLSEMFKEQWVKDRIAQYIELAENTA